VAASIPWALSGVRPGQAYTRGVDEADAARTAADAFWAAVRTGDSAAITSLMSPKAREQLVRLVRRWVPVASTAEEAAARVWGGTSGSWSALLSTAVTDSGDVQGTQAIARWDIPDLDYARSDDDEYLVLAKLDGRWVLDSLPDDENPDERPVWACES
jgi:hypothetical protein